MCWLWQPASTDFANLKMTPWDYFDKAKMTFLASTREIAKIEAKGGGVEGLGRAYPFDFIGISLPLLQGHQLHRRGRKGKGRGLFSLPLRMAACSTLRLFSSSVLSSSAQA